MEDSADATLASEPGRPVHEGVFANDGALTPGARAGRYVIEDRLGAGAMGTVYAAHDPELDRRVAIKVLTRRAGSNAERRLTREAQALAQLEHPNVVAVYDVGRIGAQVFVAMAFVDGQTLRHWQADQTSWRMVLAAYQQAAAGLEAAHSAGLVHRDFKPDNVMISSAGRVQVMDFGLARVVTGSETGEVDAPLGEAPRESFAPSASAERSGSRVPSSFSGELTVAGAILGTPVYMSPEQHLGEEADARSDQFSFCVALWEALYGERPFMGNRLASVALCVLEEAPRKPKARRGVPRSLHRVLLRGLSRDPAKRFPSMAALSLALARAAGLRLRLAAGLVTMAALGGFVLVLSLRSSEPEHAPACQHPERALAPTWTPERGEQLVERLRGRGPRGAAAASALGRALEPWLASWIAGQRDACEAGLVRRDQSERLVDRRMACLDRARLALDVTLDVVTSAEDEALDHVHEAIASLPDPRRCADLRYLESRASEPDDPASRERASRVRELLERGRALTDTARYDEARRMLELVQAELEATELPMLEAALALQRGRLLEETGEYESAVEQTVDAYASAREFDVDDIAAQASSSLVSLFGDRLGRFDESMRWAKVALAEQANAGSNAQMCLLAHRLAVNHMRMGNLDEAERWAKQAVEDPTCAADSPVQLATSLLLESNICVAAHRGVNCLDGIERALVACEAEFGPEHPNTASALVNVGNLEASLGDLDKAMQRHRRAHEIFVATLGPNHPHVATTSDALGSDAADLDDREEAIRWFERALEARAHSLGDDHPDQAISRHNLANSLIAIGELDRALELHLQALHEFELNLGPDHDYVIYALEGVANALIALERKDEALVYATRQLELTDPDNAEWVADARELIARCR